MSGDGDSMDDDPLQRRAYPDRNPLKFAVCRYRATERLPALAIAALLLLSAMHEAPASAVGSGAQTAPLAQDSPADCGAVLPVAAAKNVAAGADMYAQACPPPPRCRSNERPCYISRNAAGCMTWRCCPR